MGHKAEAADVVVAILRIDFCLDVAERAFGQPCCPTHRPVCGWLTLYPMLWPLSTRLHNIDHPISDKVAITNCCKTANESEIHGSRSRHTPVPNHYQVV